MTAWTSPTSILAPIINFILPHLCGNRMEKTNPAAVPLIHTHALKLNSQLQLQRLQKLRCCQHSAECIEPQCSLAADQFSPCSARLGCSLGPLTRFCVRLLINSCPKKCNDFTKRLLVFLKCMLVSIFGGEKSVCTTK